MPMKNHKQSIFYTRFKMLKRETLPDGWHRRYNSSKKSPRWRNWNLLKGDQSWVFTGRTDIEVETPILWPPDVKSWLTGKDLDAGKDWGQEKGTTEDEMVGWQIQWTWVWVDSGSWWGTGRPGRLRFMGSQRVGHNWATELNWTESKCD